MDQAKAKSYLEMATNLAVLLVAIVLLGTFARNYFAPQTGVRLESGLQKGKTFSQLPGVDYGSSVETVVVALNSKCDFCKESLRFYKQLAETQRKKGTSSTIVAIFPDTDYEVKEFMRQNDFDMKSISNIDFKAIGLVSTPTMILVDSSGKIVDFWIGKLSNDVEQQVLKGIT